LARPNWTGPSPAGRNQARAQTRARHRTGGHGDRKHDHLGELGPGDRLHTERDLAQRLGISRSTIREAIRGLNMLRVLDVRHGDGIFITSLDSRSLLQVTGLAMQLLRDHEVLDMFEVRAILEGSAAALASARITEEQRAALGDRLQVLDAATGIDDLLEADIAFHASVAAAAANPMLASLLDTFSARTYRARYLKASVGFDEIIVDSRAAHRRIYEAVVSRDPEVARAAASAHVASVASWLRSVLVLPDDAAHVGHVVAAQGVDLGLEF